jgi:hypothetical protein
MRTLGVSVVGVLAVLAVSLPLAPAQAAAGLEPGVHIDPGSPAAKQYALPLNQARQTGADPSGHAGSSASAPFGAGIHPPGSGGSSHPGSSANRNHAQARHTTSRASSAEAPGTGVAISPITLREASSNASPGGDRSLLVLLGGAVAILILGAFGGTLMRRNHRSLPPA